MRTYEECLDKLLELREDMRNAKISLRVNKLLSNPTLKDKENMLYWEHEIKKREQEYYTSLKAIAFTFEKTAYQVQLDISTYYSAICEGDEYVTDSVY